MSEFLSQECPGLPIETHPLIHFVLWYTVVWTICVAMPVGRVSMLDKSLHYPRDDMLLGEYKTYYACRSSFHTRQLSARRLG